MIANQKQFFMKFIRISVLFFSLSSIMCLTACKKSFYTNVNTNPNAPAVVLPSSLLSTVEGALAYSQGGDMSRFTSMFVQQTNGVARQSQAYNQYIFTGQDVDALWGNLYTSVMENDIKLMTLADGKGYNYYSGISRLLMAYTLQITVDNWGKIPYSQAFQGFANLQPQYDDDQILYANIIAMCDSGISYLSKGTAGFAVPGSEDVIYSGNVLSWIKFAHAIKARLYLHQSKGNGTMATNALSEVALSFSSNADNAVYGFGASSNSNNPWYQFNNQRGDISFATSTLATNLLSSNDPRFSSLIDTTAANGGDYLGAYYGGPNAVVELITYEELQFMAAEASIVVAGTTVPVAAQTFYKSGINASMQKFGVATGAVNTYLASQGTLKSNVDSAKMMIGNQVNISLYLNPEAWTTWRRLGYPQLTSNKAGSNIPRRLLYPQTEYSYNTANTPVSSLYTPLIFWDK